MMIAFSFAVIAFAIDKFEIVLVGFKHGFCRSNWLLSQVSCCSMKPEKHNSLNVFKSGYVMNTKDNTCMEWVSWSTFFHNYPVVRLDYGIYVVATVTLATIACMITLTTKITTQDRVMYTACGSGVPEVKTILSGFVIRRFLGTYTLIAKTATLVLAIASGMSLGKEGPYVHLAAAVGNIILRHFPFIYENESLKKQILSASASAGVALAFGSPLGGVLFILEEINHYLPSHQLFQIFFCATTSTLFLKFLNPYGTGKTVLFELKYESDWRPIELLFFIGLGVSGGIFGAMFVKFVAWWPKKFRTHKLIQNHPIFEVVLISLLTGVITFWNPYTKQASLELVLDLATPCSFSELDRSLCPTSHNEYMHEISSLVMALVIKIILTFVTFGLKLPCGIYVPSMVVGALYGRIVAMIIQWLNLTFETSSICTSKDNCVDFGIYAMIGAGAFMAGVTRMNITLVTILFELTSSYTYVLPISVAIAVANWTGAYFEKNSLYEELLIINDFPFMTSENEAIDPFVTAGEIIGEFAEAPLLLQETELKIYIDVTESPYVSTSVLQAKLVLLASRSLLDGCIPLIKNRLCVGLLFFSDLELCLDNIAEFRIEYNVTNEIYCKLLSSTYSKDAVRIHEQSNRDTLNLISHAQTDYFNYGAIAAREELVATMKELTTLYEFVDKSPIFLNFDSELCLAHLIFDKIGNRVIVLLKEGKYYGVLHKKVLIDYCRSHGDRSSGVRGGRGQGSGGIDSYHS